jgi:hypothetical protein
MKIARRTTAIAIAQIFSTARYCGAFKHSDAK